MSEQNNQGGAGKPPGGPATESEIDDWGEADPAGPAPAPGQRRVNTLVGGTPTTSAQAAPENPVAPGSPAGGPKPRLEPIYEGAAAPPKPRAAVAPAPPAGAPRRPASVAPPKPPPRRGPVTFGTPPPTAPAKPTNVATLPGLTPQPGATTPSPPVVPGRRPGSVPPPAPPARTAQAAHAAHAVQAAQAAAPAPEPEAAPTTAAGELQRRAERLRDEDAVGAARAYVELGLYLERVTQDRAAARAAYESARGLSRTLEPALTRVRRLLEGRAETARAIEILDDELAVAEGDALKADLYAERARACDSLGRMADARANLVEALRLAPLHAAALRGLESVLRRELEGKPTPALAAQLATHLERLAEAYAPAADRGDGDGRLAAWIHVERAGVLDRRLDQPEVARLALERAVAFEPAPGPVRDALSRHLVRRGETGILIASLNVEAEHERDDDRASRLLYTAARMIVDKLGAPSRVADARARESEPGAADAVHMLTRASARAPQSTPTARRILAELIRLLEQEGKLDAAAEVRQKRLPLLTVPEAVAHEHVRLSEIFDGLGRADQAALHAERALALDPDDGSTRDRLDRALQRLGRHEDRVRTWVMEANATRPMHVRIDAMVRAADIAERHLRRRDEAIAHLRAGWAVDPGNAAIFEGLSALLAPPARDPETDGRGVRARIELYTQAAQAAGDKARKVGLLEKLVSIWEDELGQPARAIEEIEKILAIEPGRRTAILALSRNAQRAGDHKQLARALTTEAGFTQDPALQRRLLLRAAEVQAERLGDRDRGLSLIDRALAIDGADPEALRARFRFNEKAGRFDEARRTLVNMISREPDDGRRFALWIEVALLDEQRLHRTSDAAEAYRQAALARPRHPLPAREIARLLRSEGNAAKLVEALMALAGSAADAGDYARFLFQAAEVQELMLGDDRAALKSLVQADSMAEAERDPALLEAMERIHLRAAAAGELATLYTRWIERQPPPAVDHRLRVALAGVLSEGSRSEAVGLLEGLVAVVPAHVPALRMLEQLHRGMASFGPLCAVLRAEADVFGSRLARAGALWEVVALEEQVGGAAAIEALGRITAEDPRDTAALDATVRLASKLTAGVAVPHPAALATRARLVPAIKARKDLARDPIARAIYQIEEALLIETQAPDDANAARAALGGYHAAIAAWPESLLGARGLERLGERLSDRGSVIAGQKALARLAERPQVRAAHLVRAAGLIAEDPLPRSQAEALHLYEEALRADASSAHAALALARMLAADVPRLVDRLGEALESASRPEQIVLLGVELGRAVLRYREAAPPAPPARGASMAGAAGSPAEAGPDAGIGVSAMRRVLAIKPDDVGALLLTARLLFAQRVWAEARDTLLRAITAAPPNDGESRIVAHFLLADIYESRLVDLAQAQGALQAVLAVDDKNRRALERLHQVATARGDRPLGIQMLLRLAEVTPDPAGRVEVDLRIAEACREAGDAAGRVRAFADAIATAPSDGRAWTALARLYRPETQDGAAGYAAALQQVLDVAAARRLPVDHRWLTTIGMLEVTLLMRPREGVAHLQQAVALPGSPPDARVGLGRGLEAAGRNAEAVQVFRDVMTADAEVFSRIGELGAGLASLEAALAKDGRVEERLAVEEVRACLGEVKTDRVTRLRARRQPEGVPYAGAFAGAEIGHALVPEARTPLLEVAGAIAPIAAKILRFELSGLGVTSRDRLGPRDGHPTRAIADRLAKALGIEAFELYLSASWQGAARVYPGDPPAIVGSTTFADLPDPEQVFALGRLLTRIALGPTWLDELQVDAVDGLFLAAIRAVDPPFGSGELSAAREAMAQSFTAAVQKAIGRRQKKLLEEILPTLTGAYDARAIAIGVRRSEYRIAYVLGGDLVSAVDYLRRFDREIGRASEDPRVLLQHPVTNELLRYALGAESFNERRRVGSVWGG